MMMAQSRLETKRLFLRDLLLSRKFSQQCLLSSDDPVGNHIEPNRESHLNPPSTRLESQWQHCCSNTVPAGETLLETLSRLNDAVYRWLRPEERTKEQIIDMVVLERFLALLPMDMQAWLKARRPGNSQEAAELVDTLLRQQESTDIVKGQNAERGIQLPVMKARDQSAPLTTSEWVSAAPKQNILYWEVLEEEEENGTSKVLRVLNNGTPQSKASSVIQSERNQLESIHPVSMYPVSTCSLSLPDIVVVDIEGGDFWQEDPTKERNDIVSQYIKQNDNYENCPWLPQGRIWQEGHPWKKEETSNCSASSLEKRYHPQIHQKSDQEMYTPPASLMETTTPRTSEMSSYKQHECGRCLNITGFTALKPNCSAFLTHGTPTKQERSYPCKDSGKSSSGTSTLIHHQMIHTDQKPHGCCECGKHFRYQSALARHQKIHTGEKPHQCHYCGKSFRLKSSLTTHQRIHTGDKPFPCPLSRRKFNRRSRLIHHFRAHTGEQPHQCIACGKSFGLRLSLAKHAAVHSKWDGLQTGIGLKE